MGRGRMTDTGRGDGQPRLPAPISRLALKPLGGIKANAAMRFGNLWASSSDIQTCLETAWGNQGQCCNALREPLGLQLRYLDLP